LQLNGYGLRFARARSYIQAMQDREYWRAKLREAEAELEAGSTLTAVNAAAKRLMLARRELKLLEQAPKRARRSNRGRASAGVSS
jgi:hypothetical protein